MGKIPDRWRDYTPFHKLLEVGGERMIAVKTPLCEVYNKGTRFDNGADEDLLEEHEQFTPEMLVTQVREKLGANVTCVIDLTFTNRYYTKSHLPDGVYHYKLKVPGRQTPDRRICGLFNKQLRKCFSYKDSCVAVHCTHGVNRTGYLLSQYLMKHHGMNVDEAVSSVTESRGHDIDRTEYVQALRDNAAFLVTDNYQDEVEAPDHALQQSGGRHYPARQTQHYSSGGSYAGSGHAGGWAKGGGRYEAPAPAAAVRRDERFASSYSDSYTSRGYSQSRGSSWNPSGGLPATRFAPQTTARAESYYQQPHHPYGGDSSRHSPAATSKPRAHHSKSRRRDEQDSYGQSQYYSRPRQSHSRQQFGDGDTHSNSTHQAATYGVSTGSHSSSRHGSRAQQQQQQ
eukprot:scpid84254/ scgid9049/ RNA/RNP complex-1-interacting phosphatase; Dual specificity protein phosphatase 11; Phosphatase that interacts with RNA/RNP complex 1